MDSATTPPHPFTIPNYRAYWLTRLSSMLALYCMMLIVGWQAYNIARETMDIASSSARLGMIGLLQFAPLFVLTPWSDGSRTAWIDALSRAPYCCARPRSQQRWRGPRRRD